MTDDFRTLMEKWLEQQQAYWAQLSANDLSAHGIWGDFLKDSTPNGDKGGEPQQRILAQLAGQILVLNQYAEPFFKALQNPSSGMTLTDTIEHWLDALQQQAGQDATQSWKLPDNLTSLLHASGIDAEQLLDGAALEALSRLFVASGATASDARAQALEALELLLDYQQALQQYLGQIGEITHQGAIALSTQLSQADSAVTSLAGLHDLWVEHYEHAYRQQAFGTAFQAAHGRLSNAHMRLHRFAQQVRDARLKTAGLATQHELRQLRREAHVLRKQVRQLRLQQKQQQDREATATAPDNTAMQALRAELEALRSEIRKPAPRPATGRKRQA
uniref:poly(R)-hydroxyalkanoic acid synthase subunit PhaE n=1 Tax=Marinobacterium profundum TaxID=1714300 RepID=UPI0008306EE1|nr:poly(R)-hydroxyalkanoic acid synthase subunit PhaE [Marinobacterium profundum]